MSRKPIPVLVFAVLCALVLVAAGCGGKKKAASPGTNAASTSTAASTQAATTEATTTTSSSNNGTPSKDCQQFATAASKIGQDFSDAVSGTNPDISKATKEFDQLTAKAPSDIRPDFQTIDDAFKKLAGAFNGGKPDIQKLQKVSSEINQAKLQAAAQHISSWAQKNCSH